MTWLIYYDIISYISMKLIIIVQKYVMFYLFYSACHEDTHFSLMRMHVFFYYRNFHLQPGDAVST